MSQIIKIQIIDKIATCLTELPIVCGNSDYVVEFDFDEEWDAHSLKTARFKVNGEYTDVVFEGNECSMPIILNSKVVWVGVYAGELSTSTPALVRCKPGILDGEDVPAPPREDVYSQIIELCEDAVATAESVEKRANEGEFEGEKGNDGLTPYIKDGNWWIGEEDTGVKADYSEDIEKAIYFWLSLNDEATVNFTIEMSEILPYDIEVPVFICYHIPDEDFWAESTSTFTIPAGSGAIYETLVPDGNAEQVWVSFQNYSDGERDFIADSQTEMHYITDKYTKTTVDRLYAKKVLIAEEIGRDDVTYEPIYEYLEAVKRDKDGRILIRSNWSDVHDFEDHEAASVDMVHTIANFAIDERLGDISTALDTLHEYAQNLVSGGES